MSLLPRPSFPPSHVPHRSLPRPTSHVVERSDDFPRPTFQWAAWIACALMLTGTDAGAQRRTPVYEQQYLPGSFNWAFRDSYRAADGLFNAFDYGHSILYEKLWTEPGADPSSLEQREFDNITKRILVRPPRLALAEEAIEPQYAKLAPEAKLMFEWAHVLHRQLYDVWADERLAPAQKDARIAELLRYYKSRPDLAFSSVPKSMELMEGQPYSLAFRRTYPKFNGLIWAYHWLQVGLYDALIAGSTATERQANVNATVARFWQMLDSAPARTPSVMPMTAAVAPRFAARYPEAAIIFDNLHGMHDVISDILASPLVPRAKKREAILRAGAAYRDSSSYAMTREAWLKMAIDMGVDAQGGPALAGVTPLPVRAPATGHEHHMMAPPDSAPRPQPAPPGRGANRDAR